MSQKKTVAQLEEENKALRAENAYNIAEVQRLRELAERAKTKTIATYFKKKDDDDYTINSLNATCQFVERHCYEAMSVIFEKKLNSEKVILRDFHEVMREALQLLADSL